MKPPTKKEIEVVLSHPRPITSASVKPYLPDTEEKMWIALGMRIMSRRVESWILTTNIEDFRFTPRGLREAMEKPTK